MDLNSGEKSDNLRNPASEQTEIVSPQPIGEVVCPHGVKAGIAQKYGNDGGRRRVALKYRPNVFANGLKEAHISSVIRWPEPTEGDNLSQRSGRPRYHAYL
jgi:hypothetical protein